MNAYAMYSSYEQPSARKFLYWCAGANTDYLSQCPKSEQIKYESLGGILCLTAFISGASMFMAISTIWIDRDWSHQISIVFAFVWAAFIFLLDRFIITGLRDTENVRRRVLVGCPRILLAVFIGLTVATPLHLKIFEPEILHGAQLKVGRDISEVRANREALHKEEYNRQQSLNTSLTTELAYRESLNRSFADEMSRGGRGPKVVAIENNIENSNSIIADLQDKISASIAEIKLIEAKDANSASFRAAGALGLVERHEILLKIITNSTGSLLLVVTTTFLIILIEITPVLAQITMPLGPYDSWVSADYGKMSTLAQEFVSVHNGGRLRRWNSWGSSVSEAKIATSAKSVTDRDEVDEHPYTNKVKYSEAIKSTLSPSEEESAAVEEKSALRIVVITICIITTTVFCYMWHKEGIEQAIGVGGVLGAILASLVPVILRTVSDDPAE